MLFIASFFLDEPLRKSTETKLNQHIKDYTFKVPSLHFQLIDLTVTLKNLTISQNAHPRPSRCAVSGAQTIRRLGCLDPWAFGRQFLFRPPPDPCEPSATRDRVCQQDEGARKKGGSRRLKRFIP